MERLVETCKAFFNTPSITTLLSIFGALFVYLFSVEKPELLLILFVLMTLDMVTGMFASRAIGLPISSRRWFHSVVKLVFYLSALIMANMVVKSYACVVDNEDPKLVAWIPTAILLWLSGLEVKSINENFRNLGYKIPAYIEDRINKIFDAESYTRSNKK